MSAQALVSLLAISFVRVFALLAFIVTCVLHYVIWAV